MVTYRTHARCSRVTSLIGNCAFSFCDRVSLCRVGSANGNHSGFQLATRFRKPTLRNGYIWVMTPRVTLGSSASKQFLRRIFLRWYINMITKIVPSNINDPRKHLQHRDQRGSTSNLWTLHQHPNLHGKQLGNLMRLLGNSPEPRVLHPSGRERRHHCLLQDQGAILFTPGVTLERHTVDVQKAVAEFREESARHDLLSITSTTTCLIVHLCKNDSASTTGIQDLDVEKKVLLRNRSQVSGTSSHCRKQLNMLTMIF